MCGIETKKTNLKQKARGPSVSLIVTNCTESEISVISRCKISVSKKILENVKKNNENYILIYYYIIVVMFMKLNGKREVKIQRKNL